jgi:hypothetical protein
LADEVKHGKDEEGYLDQTFREPYPSRRWCTANWHGSDYATMDLEKIICGMDQAMQSWFREKIQIFMDGALYGALNPITQELIVPALYRSLALHRVGERRTEVVLVGHRADDQITVHDSVGKVRFGPIDLLGESLSPLRGLIAANDEAMLHALGIWGQAVELCAEFGDTREGLRIGDRGVIGFGLPPGYLVGMFSFDREVPVTRLSRQDSRKTLGIAFEGIRLICR